MPFAQLKDLKLYYEVHGEGPPFLFVSETACHGEVWKTYQVPEFSRDHRVIIYDQRGTGRSDKPSMDYTTGMLADDAASLLDHLGAEQAIVYGHSMGGRVAQLLALDYPRKVNKLILASSGASHTASGIPLNMCLELVEKGYERYARDHAIRIGFTTKFVQEHPAEVEKFLEIRLANLPPLECYLRHAIARQAHDTSGRLKDIRVPTLVTVGDDEARTTSDISHWTSADILARTIPRAKLVVFPDSGHYYFFAKPEATNKAIREFLTEA
ncbi:MAG: alpha/beta fold hydrolase [Deltaproteobacteria bacterium]|nr:alpha/beta fold hydrolase [Deltaproteobacteria bacterium]